MGLRPSVCKYACHDNSTALARAGARIERDSRNFQRYMTQLNEHPNLPFSHFCANWFAGCLFFMFIH